MKFDLKFAFLLLAIGGLALYAYMESKAVAQAQTDLRFATDPNFWGNGNLGPSDWLYNGQTEGPQTAASTSNPGATS